MGWDRGWEKERGNTLHPTDLLVHGLFGRAVQCTAHILPNDVLATPPRSGIQ